jgi:crotonobetainyl-CoA:carnitine CoA-transferase CaiB-like acyl-CoA transferase
MSKALEGVRIIENSLAYVASFSGMMLADLGAEVIKTEAPAPGIGDYLRPYHKEKGRKIAHSIFTYLHRNKKSIALDLKKPQAVKIFKDLVKVSDVVLENYSPGVMERLGLGYEELKNINPGIVYTSLSAFGHTGPDRNRRGFDMLMQGRSGLISVTRSSKGEPIPAGIALIDYLTGLNGAVATLAALRYREKTGKGQHIDISMLECINAANTEIHAYNVTEVYKYRYSWPFSGHYGKVKCKDGYIVIAVLSDSNWKSLLKAVGRLDLLSLVTTRPHVDEKIEKVNKVVHEWLSKRSCEESLNVLLENGVPAGPIQTIPEVSKDPQLRARNAFVKVYNPDLEREQEIVNSVFKMTETPGRIERHFPALGEHTEEVLKNLLGYSEKEILKLSNEKVFG